MDKACLLLSGQFYADSGRTELAKCIKLLYVKG